MDIEIPKIRLYDDEIIKTCNNILLHNENNIIPYNDSIIIKIRYDIVHRIRSYIDKLSKKYNIKIDTQGILTRWLFTQQLINDGKDLIIPYVKDIDKDGAPCLYNEILKNFNIDKSIENDTLGESTKTKYVKLSKEISTDIIKYTNNLYKTKIEPLINKKINDSYYPLINVIYTNDGAIFKLRNDKFSLLSMYYIKIKSLYMSNLQYKFNEDKFNEDIFHYKIYLLLNRYETMLHAGYQVSIPHNLSILLTTSLGVDTEMFASPLNCLYQKYYSAYPDVDNCFGSLGSIFKSYKNITSGSFESNPPYTEDFMLLNAYIIEYILNKSENTKKQEPLSFVIINPNWKDTPSFNMFIKSKYNRLSNKYLNLKANKHTYLDGRQYRKKNPYYKSIVGSHIYILQNNAGSNKWPVTNKLIYNIIKKF